MNIRFHWKPFLAGALTGLLLAIIGLMLLSSIGRTFVFVAAIYLLTVFIAHQSKPSTVKPLVKEQT